jgi:putative PIN family toxin of toxin-antitoxin system
MRKIVVDTNVLLAALRLRNGASFKLISLIGQEKFEVCISVSLILEYEEQCQLIYEAIGLTENDIQDVLNYLCWAGTSTKIHFLWRPFLHNIDDDMILELAVAGGCDSIVTYNLKDFKNVEQKFGIKVISPKQFLQEIGEI